MEYYSPINNRTVIVADDDDVTRQLLGSMLRAAGCVCSAKQPTARVRPNVSKAETGDRLSGHRNAEMTGLEY